MRIVRIGEIAKAKGGKRLPKGMRVQDDPTPYRYLRVVDMGDRFVDRSSIRFITRAAHEATRRYTIASSDVYVSIAGTIGRVGRLPSDLDGIHLTENAAKITEIDPGADPSYLAFYLQSSLGQEQIRARTVGTSQPKLALFRIEEIEISLPPLEVQRAVVSAIGGFDDLIENNRRRIEILEEMARLLYREWFVHFRFPGHEGVELVDSELGPIPEGWEARRLSVLVTTQYGYTESAQAESVGPRYLRGMDMNKTSYIDWSTVPYCPIGDEVVEKFRVALGDVFVIRMADPGKVSICEQEIDAVFASYLVRIRPSTDDLTPYYLYFTLSDDRYQGWVTGASTGSTRKSVSAKVMTEPAIILPPRDLQQEFVRVVATIRELLTNLLKQNAALREARDLLLPRLVSGELDVSELDLDGVLA